MRKSDSSMALRRLDCADRSRRTDSNEKRGSRRANAVSLLRARDVVNRNGAVDAAIGPFSKG
jgi:hypothetical protein